MNTKKEKEDQQQEKFIDKKAILSIIPKDGIPIRLLLKELGISIRHDKDIAKKLLRLLKKLEKQKKLIKFNKTYYPYNENLAYKLKDIKFDDQSKKFEEVKFKEEISEETILSLIPIEGISTGSILEILGLFAKGNMSSAKKVYEILRILKNKKVILEHNNNYYPYNEKLVFIIQDQKFDKFLERLEEVKIEEGTITNDNYEEIIADFFENKVWTFEKQINDYQFRENLSKLGEFEYYDEELDKPIIFKYWTDTRWKIVEIEGKKYILSPAFWDDEEIQVRFALICNPKFNLNVYLKRDNKEKIIGRIGCFKVIIDYSTDLEPTSTKHIKLTIKDELLATIQNLDHFFTEQKPYFMSFDYDIVHQALELIVDKGFGSKEILNLRCDEIKEIILQLIKTNKDESKINPQIYIQLKALLDFNPEKWIHILKDKLDIWKYFERMAEIEEEDTLYKLSPIILNNLKTLKIKNRKEIDPKIYNQIKTLLGFDENEWVVDLKDNLDIWKYLEKICVNEKSESEIFSALYAISKLSDERALNLLLKLLDMSYKSKQKYQWDIQSSIIRILGDMGFKKAIPPLFELWKKERPRDRFWGLKVVALGKLGDERVLKFLLHMLGYFYIGLLIRLAIPPKSLKIYLKYLDHLSSSAAETLGMIGYEKAVDPLIQALKKGTKGLRRTAAMAIGKIGAIKAIDPLIKALNNEEDEILDSIIWALSDIARAHEDVIDKIRTMGLEKLIKYLKSKRERVRHQTAEALGVIGDERAIDPLIQALTNNDDDPFFRHNLFFALTEIGDPRVIEPLKKAIEKELDTETKENMEYYLEEFLNGELE